MMINEAITMTLKKMSLSHSLYQALARAKLQLHKLVSACAQLQNT